MRKHAHLHNYETKPTLLSKPTYSHTRIVLETHIQVTVEVKTE